MAGDWLRINGLLVEIDANSATMRRDNSGIKVATAFSGKPLVTRLYDPRNSWPFTTMLLSQAEYEALEAAADYPNIVLVEGYFLGESAPGVNRTMDARVLISEAVYIHDGDIGHWRRANIQIDKAEQ